MLALMNMLNPFWEWIFAPLILIGIGWGIRDLEQAWKDGRIDFDDADYWDTWNTPYNWEDEEEEV